MGHLLVDGQIAHFHLWGLMVDQERDEGRHSPRRLDATRLWRGGDAGESNAAAIPSDDAKRAVERLLDRHQIQRMAAWKTWPR